MGGGTPLGEDFDELVARIERAVAAAEAERNERLESMRRAQERRDAVLTRIVQLHDGILRLRASGGLQEEPEIREEVRSELDRLLGRLTTLLQPAKEEAGTPPEPASADRSPPTPSRPAGEGTAAEPDARAELEAELRPIYQEILTLEEHEGLFSDEELHRRIQVLLARMRRIQDGPHHGLMTAGEKAFMTQRFGLLQGLQKRRRLPYLLTLNRDQKRDWDRFIREEGGDDKPLNERVEELLAEREAEERRRRAAQALMARRRLEGEELLAELRLFLRGPDLGSEAGKQVFRRLVAECSRCLSAAHPELLELVAPHMELLHGREFKRLRRLQQKTGAGGTAAGKPAGVVEEPVVHPSATADREEALKGVYRGRRGLILGGQRRRKAEEILRDHLGLEALRWLSAEELARQDPARAEALIRETAGGLLIVLAADLRAPLEKRLLEAAEGVVVVRVEGGQELSRILEVVPLPDPPAPTPPSVRSVREAVESVARNHPEALVFAFNSASTGMDCPFEDAVAVRSALEFLATTYRDARSGRASCPDLDLELRQRCGFFYRPHQSSVTMGRFSESYTAVHEGRRYELREHIGKGTGRDGRHSIRIAFTYLEDEDRVLIGFLGQHQRTTAT